MKTYTEAELNEILRNHKHWMLEDVDGWEGMRADLCRANLTGANLRGADLYGANLYEANYLEDETCEEREERNETDL